MATDAGVATARAAWRHRLGEPDDGMPTIVARVGGRIVGFAYVGPSPDAPATTGHVFSLHVDPDVARRGVGRLLLDDALARFAAAGWREATLWVVARNVKARRFYERLGWRPDGAARREPLALDDGVGPDVDVVRYRRRIGARPGQPTPKYYELRQWLRHHLDGLPPGTPVEPERLLSERFQLSRMTVRQALHDLAVEGRIVREQGRGTFVAPPKLIQQLALTSFTDAMSAQGRRPGARVVDAVVAAAEEDVAERLGLDAGAEVVRIERVRLADGEPMAVETVYLDHGRFPAIGDELADDMSLYALLAERYGVVAVEGNETIETVIAPPAAARLLGTDATTPMLLLTRSTRDRAGRPVEYVRSLYRGDRFSFAARITPRG